MPHLLKYTDAEQAILAALYPCAKRAAVLAALPGRSWNSIGWHASAVGIRRSASWPPAELAVLRADYPRKGAVYVARVLNKAINTVIKRAQLLGIVREWLTPEEVKRRRTARNRISSARRYAREVAGQVVRRKPEPKQPVKAAPVARPSATAVPLLAVKQSTHTPNLNMARESRKRKEAARSAAPITSEEIRKLPANHPARHAYAMGGVVGWQQWQAKQAA